MTAQSNIPDIKGLTLEELTELQGRIEELKKKEALKELDKAEARVNELRRAAGMKARPPGKKAAT